MKLPNFEKLPLECALDDPPQLRTLTAVFSADVTAQHDYLASLHRLTSRLVGKNMFHDKLSYFAVYIFILMSLSMKAV